MKAHNHFASVLVSDYRFGRVAWLKAYKTENGKTYKDVFVAFRSEMEWRKGIGFVFLKKRHAENFIKHKSNGYLYPFEELALNQCVHLFGDEVLSELEGYTINPLLIKSEKWEENLDLLSKIDM